MQIGREVKRKDLDVYFSGRFAERYKEAMANIDNTLTEMNQEDVGGRDWIKIDRLEREIKARGNFFKPESDDKDEFICTVNNLKVYKGFFKEEKVYVTTAYEYSKQSRNKIKTMDTIRFRGE